MSVLFLKKNLHMTIKKKITQDAMSNFVIANSADQYSAAFHLDLHCLQIKYPFMSIHAPKG